MHDDNFYILRGSNVVDITSYPSFLVMSISFDPRKVKNCSFWKCELKPSEHACKISFNYSKLCAISFFARKVQFFPPNHASRCFSNEFSKHYW